MIVITAFYENIIQKHVIPPNGATVCYAPYDVAIIDIQLLDGSCNYY